MPDEKTIQVQGHGEVEAAPTIGVIALAVVSREREARAAMQSASERMRAVIAAVHELEIQDRDIQTTQLNLYLDQQVNVYVASYQITVRVQDVGRAGAILDAAVEAGANASAGIQFALSDPSEPEDQALTLAVADARHKAELLAAALDVTIGRVEQVIVLGRGAVPHISFARRAPVAAAPSPVEVGQLTITADVQVTYSFRDRLD
jgi:uncharacterized protein YggE